MAKLKKDDLAEREADQYFEFKRMLNLAIETAVMRALRYRRMGISDEEILKRISRELAYIDSMPQAVAEADPKTKKGVLS